MDFGIDQITANINRLYFTKPNLYTVSIFGQQQIVPDATPDITFYCSKINIPGINLTTSEEARYRIGNPKHYPTRKEYTECRMTFYESQYLDSRQYFYNWMETIINQTNNRVQFYDNIVKNVQITQYDRMGQNITYQANLNEIYPTELGELERSYEAIGSIPSYNVGFKFYNMQEIGNLSTGNTLTNVPPDLNAFLNTLANN